MRLLAPLLMILVFVGCRRAEDASVSQAANEAGPLVHVQTAFAGEELMPEYLTLTGSLRANQESTIAADVVGKVLETLVERGQFVKRGQVIVTIDPRSAALGATAA